MGKRAELWGMLAIWMAIGTGAVAFAQSPQFPSDRTSRTSLVECRTTQGSVHFDFEGASRSSCYVEDGQTLSILVTPEHLPPINPSPWYAFRYNAKGDNRLTVNIRYLGAKHRYAPKWQGSGDLRQMQVAVAKDGGSVSITVPSGEGIVSSQPLITSADYEKLLRQLSSQGRGERLILGHSLDRRPIEAVRLGYAKASRLVILLGRQHPPEVTGAMAMDAFARKIAELVRSGAIDRKQYQFLIVPLLNPDGVARGHWRANLGGTDINRDWGPFRQPETRAVADWLSRLPVEVRPVLMLDFHSTSRNLFYVQGEEASAQGKRFLAAWLAGKQGALKGYPFEIEPRDANPGSGTTKNWFNTTYGIPAYTYEVGDGSDPSDIRSAAETLAQGLVPALETAQQ